MANKNLLIVFKIIIFSAFLILFLQLSNIQLIKSDYFKGLSKGNKIRIIKDKAPRGVIYDRNGNILVKNKQKLVATILPYNSINKKRVASYLNMKHNILLKDLDKNNYGNYKPIIIKENTTIKEAVKLEQDLQLSGIAIEQQPMRFYLHNRVASHILGYVRPITKEKYETLKKVGYQIDDIIGIDGIEAYYDRLLRGEDGGRQVEVDAKGDLIRTLGKKEPIQGENIMLTIDKDLQQFCEKKIEGKYGVIIVMNPQTFEILSLVSMPNYAPGFFQNTISEEKWNYLVHSSGKPLQNRAIANKYPPGSVFKLLVAVAALEEGIVNKNTPFYCKGYYKVGDRKFRCWKKHYHINIVQALAQSCDIVFYQLARKLGVDCIRRYALLFGIGKKTNIDLPGEIEGLLPSVEWKKRVFRERWYVGDTVNLGIGQGFLSCTPIQIAKMVSIIANGGKTSTPHLLKAKIRNTQIKEVNFEIEKLSFHTSTLNIIKEGMKETVEHGTGINAKLKYIDICGKTGTAEERKGVTPHAWFSAFAPCENPEICVVVFIENGGKGGEVAAPIAKDIFEYYFTKIRANNKKIAKYY